MSFSRLFDVDPMLGLRRIFHYDEETDTATIETQQDHEKVAEAATKIRNQFTSLDRWGDGRVVASVPMTIYSQWVAQGKDKDSKFLRRWLNDPDNRKFRVFPGRV